MATITSKVCDISADHGEAQGVVLSDGQELFTADLCDPCADKHTKAVDAFVKVGTPVSMRDLAKNGTNSLEPSAIRAWALRNNKQLGDRGRIPADIVAAYKADMKQP